MGSVLFLRKYPLLLATIALLILPAMSFLALAAKKKEDPFASLPTAYQEELEILHGLSGDHPNLLHPGQAPGLTQATQAVVDRLQPALNRIVQRRGGNETLRFRILISNRRDVNAGVIFGASRRGERVGYIVLHSGLFNSLLRENSDGEMTAQSIRIGIERSLAGVLAHEFGHYLDQFDDVGIQARYAKAGSQAIEARTDAEAVGILREAGLPTDGVYTAFKNLHQMERKLRAARPERGRNAVMALLQTHPVTEARLTEQRLLLTAEHFGLGGARVTEPLQISEAEIRGDVNRLAASWRYAGADLTGRETLDDLVAMIRTQIPEKGAASRDYERGHGRGPEHGNVFPVALHALDQMLTKRDAASFSDDEVARLASVYGDIYQNTTYGLKVPWFHAGLRQRIPLFRDARYLRHVQDRFSKSVLFPLKTPNSAPTNMGELTETLLADDADFFSIFGEQLREVALLDPAMIWDRLRNMMQGKTFPLAMAGFFQTEVIARLPVAARAAFLIREEKSRSGSDEDPLFFRGLMSDERRTEAMKQVQAVFRGKPSAEATRFRALAQDTWNQRGSLALADIFASNNRIDWPTVFQGVGISAPEGYRQLNESLSQLLHSPEFAEYVPAISGILAPRPAKIEYTGGSSASAKGIDLPAVGKGKATPWLAASVSRALVERFHRDVASDELTASLRIVLAKNRPDEIRQAYGEILLRKLQAHGVAHLSTERFNEINQEIFKDLMGVSEPSHNSKGTFRYVIRDAGLMDEIVVRHIVNSSLDPENKRELLRGFYVNSPSARDSDAFHMFNTRYSNVQWVDIGQAKARESIARNLQRAGLTNSSSGLLALMNTEPNSLRRAKGNFSNAYVLREGLKKELRGIKTSENLLQFTGSVFMRQLSDQLTLELQNATKVNDPDSYYENEFSLGRSVTIGRLIDEVLTRAQSLPMTLPERIRLFHDLTNVGGWVATDRYFQNHILPELRQNDFSIAAETFHSLLTGSAFNHQARFYSPVLQVEVARRVLDQDAARLRSNPAAVEKVALRTFLNSLEKLVPARSFARDELIENYMWRLRIHDEALLEFAQSYKSSHWRAFSPSLVNQSSFVAEHLATLTSLERAAVIDYFMNPEEELPAAVEQALRNQVERSVRAQNQGSPMQAEVLDKALQIPLGETIQKVEAIARSSSPFERAAVFEMLLNAGDSPFMASDGAPQSLIRQFLKYPAGSTQEKILTAYLRTVPEHERSVTLAYLMSLAQEDRSEGSLRPIFEVFQTVGVKAGQLSAIFRLFGDEGTRELERLKDRARPMTMLEVQQALRHQLTPDEFSRVRIEDVLGSASLKTVVSVKYHEAVGSPEREGVLLLQRPHAAEQIAANLDRASHFTQELQRMGVSLPQGLVSSMIEGVGVQLKDELNFAQEANRLRRAHQVYNQINSDLRGKLGGWQFSVPRPLEALQPREGVLLMEKARGVTFSEIQDPQMRAHVGRMIVEAGLQARFEYGFGNADPHRGNFLIDVDNRRIHPIDFGQVVELTGGESYARGDVHDERYNLAQFLRALSDGNSTRLVEFGLRLGSRSGLPPLERLRLDQKIQVALRQHGRTRPQLLSDLLDAFSSSSAPLEHKFSFGVMKELLYYGGEGYVSEADFQSLVERHVRRVLEGAPLRALTDEAAACAKRALGRVLGSWVK